MTDGRISAKLYLQEERSACRNRLLYSDEHRFVFMNVRARHPRLLINCDHVRCYSYLSSSGFPASFAETHS
jgi:hypothetical protein